MRYIGVDLHKRLVVVCVVEVQDGKRLVVERGRWLNQDTAGMEVFFRAQVPFQLVVESTSCYEWFNEVILLAQVDLQRFALRNICRCLLLFLIGVTQK
jgi:hypothetical protein